MSHTQHGIPMKGNGNQPTFQSHLELHAALVRVKGVGGRIPRSRFNGWLMERTKVGLRQSVHRYLEAWEDLSLIEKDTWKGTKKKEGTVVLLAAPDAMSQYLPAPAAYPLPAIASA